MHRTLASLAVVTAAILSGASLSRPPVHAQPAADMPEVRGLWVVRTALGSPASVLRMVEGAQLAGLQHPAGAGARPRRRLLRRRPRAGAQALARADAAFDPLASTITEAHARGLRRPRVDQREPGVVGHDLPTAPAHVVNRAPEWLMVPRALAQELSTASPDSPGYLGRLARWTRAQTARPSKACTPRRCTPAPRSTRYVSPPTSLVATPSTGCTSTTSVSPAPSSTHGRAALDGFRAAVRPDLSPATARALDARRAGDVLAYVDAMPERWQEFRRARLTALMHRLRNAVVTVRVLPPW